MAFGCCDGAWYDPNAPVPASWAAVRAAVASETPVGTTSAVLEDMAGMSVDITLAETSIIDAFGSFQCSTQVGASASTIGVAISINGVDGTVHERQLSGVNDKGIGAIAEWSATPLAAGTYTVKWRIERIDGVATPGIDHAHMIVYAHPVPA